MEPIYISVNTKTGLTLTPFKNNPKMGYIILKQDDVTFINGWMRKSTKSTLIKGAIDGLDAISKLKTLPGRIQVCEFLEDSIPPNWIKTLPKGMSLSEALTQSNAYKKAGDGGEFLTKDGKRIVRFTIYDGTGQSSDIIIQHDNGDQIAAAKAAIVDKAASLPGGDEPAF
jgi:hypothetical protein